MVRDDIGHEYRYFVGRIELAGLLARIRGELRDQVFVNVPQHVIVLARAHGDGLDKVNEIAHGLRLGASVVA